VTVVSKELVVLDLRRPVRSLLSGCAFVLMSVMSSFSDMKVKEFVGSINNGGSSLGTLLVIVIAMLSTLSGDCTDLLKWLGNLRESGKGSDFFELWLDRGCEHSGKSWSNIGFFCSVLAWREERRSDNPDSLDNSPSLFLRPPSSSNVG